MLATCPRGARSLTGEPGSRLEWNGASTLRGNRYRLLRPFPSTGNLGELFVAHDLELDREVVLKQIRESQADQSESRSRFVMEGEVTGRLEHPGVVPIYGLGHYANGRPFYAMKWIRGTTLKSEIETLHKTVWNNRKIGEWNLPVRKLLRRFVSVCETIAYAHSCGILHRDIKPANVMLGDYGETIVIDWGLAKPFGHRIERAAPGSEGTVLPSSASTTTETVEGSVLGTPQFMSPEQAAGRTDLLGCASDVFSLGATLYVILTGTPPYKGSTSDVLEQAKQGVYLRPRRVKSGVPPPLEAVCLKAMSLRPEDRYASADLLARDIEQWMADEPVSAWHEPLRLRITLAAKAPDLRRRVVILCRCRVGMCNLHRL